MTVQLKIGPVPSIDSGNLGGKSNLSKQKAADTLRFFIRLWFCAAMICIIITSLCVVVINMSDYFLLWLTI